jgi:hypothetical protein
VNHFIRELDRLFDARFIFLHREPRGFTQSGLARNWYDEPSPRQRLYTLARRKWVVDIGNFWYDHRLDPPPELTTRMERLAWLWSEINRTIMDGLEEIEPSRKMEVRLDSVGPANFSEVLRFIGVPDDEELTERMALTAALSRTRPWCGRTRWPPGTTRPSNGSPGRSRRAWVT